MSEWSTYPSTGLYPFISKGAHALLLYLGPERRSEKMDGVEVGVMSGKTSATLLDRCPNLSLTMVDNYKNPKWETSGDNALAETKFAADRRELVIDDSLSFGKKVKDSSKDFVFLDNDHTYQHVKRELPLWWKKVKKGGFLCGHDIHLEGVKKAVNEFARRRRLEVIVYKDEKTWIIEKS